MKRMMTFPRSAPFLMTDNVIVLSRCWSVCPPKLDHYCSHFSRPQIPKSHQKARFYQPPPPILLNIFERYLMCGQRYNAHDPHDRHDPHNHNDNCNNQHNHENHLVTSSIIWSNWSGIADCCISSCCPAPTFWSR